MQIYPSIRDYGQRGTGLQLFHTHQKTDHSNNKKNSIAKKIKQN